MFAITNLRDGAVLNHHHGKETAVSLTVPLEGVNYYGTPVMVNGHPARMDGARFHAEVELTRQFNSVQVTTRTPYGEFSQSVTLVWDKASFRRCSFYIDDHIFLFTELARQRPRRAFDHFYLAALRELHRKYGWKVTLNTFYRNDHEEFLLKDMPDLWKDEFEDNADWLRFSLHAYSEFPDRPYTEASRRKFREDYELLRAEVTRFAGEKSFIVPQVLHWGNISPGVAEELFRLGGKCYSEALRPRLMATPPEDELTEEELGREFRSEVYLPPSPSMAMHYGFGDEIDYLEKHTALYDSGLGIFFYHDWIISNLLPLEKIPRLFARVKRLADQYGSDLFSASSHEQYSFPSYFNYQPDHLRKLEETIRLMVEEGGCRPVFLQDGLLGNPAWEG